MLILMIFASVLMLAIVDISFGQTTYTIDNTFGLGHEFFGIGGLSGGGATSRLLPDYDVRYRNEIYDYLFKPKFGASLHILKVEIGGDTQSTEGTEASHMHIAGDENYERGYEWQIMIEAKRRNPQIKLYGLSWGYPRFLAEGGSSPLTNSTVKYIINWLNGARVHHNLTIDYIGIWNENAYSREYILSLRRAITAAGLPTVIVAADDCCDGKWSICDSILNDVEYQDAIGVIGGHYPDSQTTSACASLHKPLWASEVCAITIARSVL